MKRNNSTLLRAHSRGSFDRLVFESEHANGGGTSNRSLLFRFFQLVVLIIRSITPISYIYLLALCIFRFGPEQFGGFVSFALFTSWMAVEAAFFPIYYYIFNHLNFKSPDLNHFGTTSEKRRKLIIDCFDAIEKAAPSNISSGYNCTDAQRNVQKMVEGWFLNVPIKEIQRDNFLNWFGWAFFDKDVNDMTVSEKAELNWAITFVEGRANWRFPPGFAKNIPSARLTFDPVFATQRPCFFYLTIGALNYFAHFLLRLAGYIRRSEYDRGSQGIYYRPARKPSKTTIPIVFIHGIGIGFLHYMGMILSFPDDVDVYLVEWPHVAMQFTASVPTIDDTVDTITKILDDDQHDSAVFIGHSLGSTVIAWMLHSPSANLVASTILIDPVIFLLCDPTVATSFVYNDPETPLDFLMHFFVSRELFIANALSRHFNWSQNIMFVEEFISDKSDTRTLPEDKLHTIILATHDTIVPTPAVERYLKAKTLEGHHTFETVKFDGTHGQIMLHPSWVSYIISKVKVKCHAQ